MALYAGWCDLNFTPFRKLTIYETMKWTNSVDLSSKPVVAAARYGGPIAVMQLSDRDGRPVRSFTINIFTSVGQKTGHIQWNHGSLHSFHWSLAEDLLCVQTDGKVFVYSMFGIEKRNIQFGMGSEAQEMKISECQTFESYAGTGLAVLTTSHRIFLVNNVYDPKLWRTPEIPRRAEKPNCWTIVCRQRATRVIVILGCDIFLLSQGQAPEVLVPAVQTPVKQYIRVCLSSDESKVALLSENGLIQILSLDMKKCLCEVGASLRFGLPEQFMWCSDDAVALLDQDYSLTLFGMDQATLKFAFDEPITLVPEVDGLRILSQNQQEFLSRVPDAVCAVYQVASNAPGALLLEAAEKYHSGSHQSYDYLRLIENQLEQAVGECIEAAGHEYSVENQKQLLGSASFGKTFCNDMSSDSFVHMCRIVRVLNAIRDKHFGIPLSYSQLEHLTVAVLIDRLIARSQWPMAIAVCQHLRINPEDGVNRVLAHWAAKKIEEYAAMRSSGIPTTDNTKLADIICQKFRLFPGISYADVAAKAAEHDLKELATLLLENEPQLVRQVNMLMKLGRASIALQKATKSGDPDLIYFVILHLRRTMDKADLPMLLRKYPLAFALYKQYCREDSVEQLKALCRQEDDFTGQAICWLQQAASTGAFDVREKQDCIQSAEGCLGTAKDDLAPQLADYVRLLKHQADFEETFGQPFTDLSLRNTIIQLIELGENNKSETLRKEFKVSDKQFWWWKIEALAKAEKWADLELFSKSKKPPIGYLPFVQMCVKYGQSEQALKYHSKLSHVDDLVTSLIIQKDLNGAASTAFNSSNEQLLHKVMSHCGPQNRNLTEQIMTWKQQLASRQKK